MSSTLFKENGHLTKISFEGFKEGSLSDNELILLSEHICECEVCADALVNSFNNEELIDAPLGFEQEILAKINNRKERYNHFVFYSLRVVMAASIALMFVFSNGLNFVVNTKVEALKVNQISLSNINTISLNLNNFSQKIINMEVFNNEKGKK